MGQSRVVLNFFQMRACHSGRVFVRAVARPTQQAFLECVVAAFEYFNAVFPVVRMDYVARNIIRLLCPTWLCGRGAELSSHPAAFG